MSIFIGCEKGFYSGFFAFLSSNIRSQAACIGGVGPVLGINMAISW